MSSTTVINTSTINAPLCEDLSDTHRCPTHRSTNTNKLDGGRFPEVKRPPNQLPDPWLFDSEKLLRELDRCREMVLLIPAFTHESHFTINNAIDSLWNLRETVQFLLKLHKEGQRAFAVKHSSLQNQKGSLAATTTVPEARKVMVSIS
jgi:hypothetical protein